MARALDKYGLPPAFKVRVRVDELGDVKIVPIKKEWRQAVRASNQHDGTCAIFIQQPDSVDELREILPAGAFYYDSCTGWQVDDGAIVVMGSWEFRQMVGGQSD